MFIAMNRFKIALGHEEDFEAVWRNRESFLDGVPGFETFHLLKGATTDAHTLYASHSVWKTRAAFVAIAHDSASAGVGHDRHGAHRSSQWRGVEGAKPNPSGTAHPWRVASRPIIAW